MQTRVLVVSASMGAGHDGAARELVRRLKAEGHQAEMRDFLTSAPLRIGSLLKSSYEFQMRYVAWTYDLTYRLWYRLPALCPPLGRFMARLTGPHLLRWANEYQADVIVSTYPLTSVVLGQLRQAGRLQVPTINFITDFGVHPLWTHPGIDLNLAVHPHPAAVAEAKSGRPSIATGPMVSPRFAEPQDRAATRAELGLGADDRAVLIVSGSWGVGDVASTFKTIATSGRFVPIVVCGRDERLQERLSRMSGGRALGWTDNMPALMAATDALVENAGGLTAMEALSVGLPIISFRPIAGHGKENTAEMQDAGVSRVARTPQQLLKFLDQATTAGPARQAMIEAGKAMFVSDPTRYVQHAALVGAARLADRDVLAAVGAGFREA
ncbi:MAG: UDP-N-acetylglucosamine--N-acetylglucosamine transferase, partial [Actinomycetota bacterium]|nr:UDP-N-acetylglucosamine--N-acetylglucosamine transferase [Actinomycetota bacterium]